MCINVHLHFSTVRIKLVAYSSNELVTCFHHHGVSDWLIQVTIVDRCIMGYDVAVIVWRAIDCVSRKRLTIWLFALFVTRFASVITACSHSRTHNHVLLCDRSSLTSVPCLCPDADMEEPHTVALKHDHLPVTLHCVVNVLYVVSDWTHSGIRASEEWCKRLWSDHSFLVCNEKQFLLLHDELCGPGPDRLHWIHLLQSAWQACPPLQSWVAQLRLSVTSFSHLHHSRLAEAQ